MASERLCAGGGEGRGAALQYLWHAVGMLRSTPSGDRLRSDEISLGVFQCLSNLSNLSNLYYPLTTVGGSLRPPVRA